MDIFQKISKMAQDIDSKLVPIDLEGWFYPEMSPNMTIFRHKNTTSGLHINIKKYDIFHKYLKISLEYYLQSIQNAYFTLRSHL